MLDDHSGFAASDIGSDVEGLEEAVIPVPLIDPIHCHSGAAVGSGKLHAAAEGVAVHQTEAPGQLVRDHQGADVIFDHRFGDSAAHTDQPIPGFADPDTHGVRLARGLLGHGGLAG
ncbi:MAG: hypothetical protein HZY74_03560 [Brevundimonas sp.]|nr:MAG: hypothetical protein HZY74_03560 [Brevundimonas sp.]